MNEREDATDAADAANADPIAQVERELDSAAEKPAVRTPISINPDAIRHLIEGVRLQTAALRELRDRVVALEAGRGHDEEG